MKTKRIDGAIFKKMAQNGLDNLRNHETEVNDLNVFPVPDGDTGTNMRLTLQHGVDNMGNSENLGEELGKLADGMLMGARGNSGVILSQIFYGFSQALIRYSSANAGELRNSFIRGYKTAYQSVVHPVEGTILTVSREGIEHIRTQIDKNTDIETFFSMYVAEMKNSLLRTPELLEVLKSAGVIDSGAAGYIYIIDGMRKYLCGEIISSDVASVKVQTPVVSASGAELFNENSEFIDGYCMEFMLQLMNGENYSQNFYIDKFIDTLKQLGNSIVAVQNGKRVKVHIHTFVPGKVITLCQRFGEFIAFKLENMQIQHNEHDKKLEKNEKHVPLSIIAVSNGDGITELFNQLGCEYVIKSDSNMNTSTEEFIDMFNVANADKIVVLPNNKNIIFAAEQAVKLSGMDNIIVLPSKTITDGYYAMAMDNPASDDLDLRIKSIESGIGSSVTMSIAKATKDYSNNDICVNAGQNIAVLDDEVVFASEDWLDTILGGLEKIEDMDDRECGIIFRGENTTDSQVETLQDVLSSKYPFFEVEIVYGGQDIYDWVIGVN